MTDTENAEPKPAQEEAKPDYAPVSIGFIFPDPFSCRIGMNINGPITTPQLAAALEYLGGYVRQRIAEDLVEMFKADAQRHEKAKPRIQPYTTIPFKPNGKR